MLLPRHSDDGSVQNCIICWYPPGMDRHPTIRPEEERMFAISKNPRNVRESVLTPRLALCLPCRLYIISLCIRLLFTCAGGMPGSFGIGGNFEERAYNSSSRRAERKLPQQGELLTLGADDRRSHALHGWSVGNREESEAKLEQGPSAKTSGSWSHALWTFHPTLNVWYRWYRECISFDL